MTRIKLQKTRFQSAKRSGMKLVKGGTFHMGSVDFYDDEKPVRLAKVGDFWIDETPVTNAQFARFIAATGYISFAEVPPNPADYPGMDPNMAHPGSLLFTPPDHPVSTERAVWWSFQYGASWRQPLGPGSHVNGLADHPVVHVTHQDAAAYARWVKKALPSEAEWEYAARGGLECKTYAWGDEFEPGGVSQAKTWQGQFPHENLAPAGLERTAPVRSYPPNGFGLYDMIGNVWEWTDDWYDMRKFDPAGGGAKCCGGDHMSDARSEGSVDPDSPEAHIPRRVTKGGSHLCAPSYCQRYRPAARWPQPIDTSTSHLGFRCIMRC